MRQAKVYMRDVEAGTLIEESPSSYVFVYNDRYLTDPSMPEISLTLPKTKKEFHDEHLFPFFFDMLSEGANRRVQSRMLRIDENDHFGLLLATAGENTIGAVTVKEIV